MMITVTVGDTRDQTIARDLLWRLQLAHPQIARVWAPAGAGRTR